MTLQRCHTCDDTEQPSCVARTCSRCLERHHKEIMRFCQTDTCGNGYCEDCAPRVFDGDVCNECRDGDDTVYAPDVYQYRGITCPGDERR